MLTITRHAVGRFRERVADLPDDAIRTILSSRAIQIAIEFGAEFVRLPSGNRVVIKDGSVITVLPTNPRNKRYPRFRATDAHPQGDVK